MTRCFWVRGFVALAACFSLSANTATAYAVAEVEPAGDCVTEQGCLSEAVVLSDSRVLLFGQISAPLQLPLGEVYDPLSESWKATGPCEGCPSQGFSMTLISGASSECGPACGKVVLAGGVDQQYKPVSSTFIFSPGRQRNSRGTSGSWVRGPSMGIARGFHTANLLPDGGVLIAGGCSSACAETGEDDPVSSAEIYDAKSGRWAPTQPMKNARYQHTATALEDGRIVVVGGANVRTVPSDAVEAYEARSGDWTPLPSLTAPRFRHGAVRLKNGSLLVAGGRAGAGTPLNSAELYPPQAEAWKPTAILKAGRRPDAAALLPDGRALFLGGARGGGPETGPGEIYDSEKNEWQGMGVTGEVTDPMTATVLTGRKAACGEHCGKVLITGSGKEAVFYDTETAATDRKGAATSPAPSNDPGISTKLSIWTAAGIAATIAALFLVRRILRQNS